MNMQTSILSAAVVIDSISETIEGYAQDPSLQNASYETGLLGYALYYAYLSKYKDDELLAEKAAEYFQKSMAALDLKNFQRTYGTDSLDQHLAHVGRFLIFSSQHQLFDIDSSAYLTNLDSILYDLMKSKITIKDFDAGSGALAAGYYLLARSKSPLRDEALSYLVSSLDNFAGRTSAGDYYWHSPSLHNRVYLGISHGSALIISALVNIHACGIQQELCESILEKATGFLIKHYRRSPYKGLFPTKIGDRLEPMQFALCYGDIGTGYALYRAAQALDSPRIMDFARMVLDDCLTRTKEDNMTLDASIYYGAAGLGISFDRVGELTGDERFTSRAGYWYDQIPRYAIYNSRFAGFQSRLSTDDVIWNVSEGWGIIGIGLALMRYSQQSLPSLHPLTFLA